MIDKLHSDVICVRCDRPADLCRCETDVPDDPSLECGVFPTGATIDELQAVGLLDDDAW